MRKYELSEIDESSLPNVSLDSDQLKKITNALKINLSDSITENKNLDVDTSLNNISYIYENLGSEKDKVIHGVKYAKVLQELIIPAFDNKYSPSSEDLIYKKFCMLGRTSESKSCPPSWRESPFYIQVYITKDSLIIYYFNHIFKMIEEFNIPIKDVKNAYIHNITSDPYDYHLNITIKSNKYPSFVGINILNDETNTPNEILDIFKKLGIPNEKINSAKLTFSYLVLIILFFFIITVALISSL